MQVATQVDAHQAEQPAEQERQAPAEAVQLVMGQEAGQQPGRARADREAEEDDALQHGAVEPDAAPGGVLGDEDHGARQLAGQRASLQQPHQQQQRRRQPAHLPVRRQQPDAERGDGHQQQRQQEHLLAADLVAEMRDDDAGDRPDEIAQREDRVGLQQPHPFRALWREEHAAQDEGQEHEHGEVVVFECRPDGA